MISKKFSKMFDKMFRCQEYTTEKEVMYTFTI